MKDEGGAVQRQDEDQRYRAPALEKGLDILELLSRKGEPLSVAMITQMLDRSTGELFRMLQVLEHRGYIEQRNGGFVVTTKLFSLGMIHAPTKNLLEAALPAMRTLAERIEQSCHLATRSGGEIMVVARMESASLIGFSVRLGYRQPVTATASGSTLYAFQSPEVRKRWEQDFAPIPADELERFRRNADKIASQGFDQRVSSFVPGILDLSAPVMRGAAATAALTIPFVMRTGLSVGIDDALVLVRETAAQISSELAFSDVRL